MEQESSRFSESEPHDQPEEAAAKVAQPANEPAAAISRPDMQHDTSTPQAGAGRSAQAYAQSQQLSAALSSPARARPQGYWWTPGLDDDGGDLPGMQQQSPGEHDCETVTVRSHGILLQHELC